MKKFIVIVTMIFSAAAMTACGNKTDKDNQNDANTTNVPENQDKEDNNDNNTEDNQNIPEENQDQTDIDNTNDTNLDADSKDTDSENGDANEDNNDENNADKTDKTDKTDSNSQEELIETGEKPDIKVNKKGRFNGRYQGNDGCIYEFTKKGRMKITSDDSEVVEYTYQLDGDRLSMVTLDETMGIGRQITLLEDGTYLLDDTMGNQVILTYIED